MKSFEDVRYRYMTNIRLWLLMFFLCAYSMSLYAQYDTINSHIIVAFDNALHPKYKSEVLNKKRINNAVAKLLTGMDLGKGDYFSLVNFGINNYDNDINNLARPIKDSSGKTIVWRPFISVDSMFQGSWSDMVDKQGMSKILYASRHDVFNMDYEQISGEPFSLLTGAKAFVLSSVRSSNEKDVANKTYLIMITDDHYNGNDDQNKEFDKMGETLLSKSDFLGHCYNTAKAYNFRYVKSVVISDYLDTGSLQAIMYEVVPSMYVSLNSVVDYPANMGIERVNGGYKMNFKFKSVSDIHELKRLTICVFDENESQPIECYTYNGEGEVDTGLQISPSSDSVVIKMDAWLLQRDGIYNGALLSPCDSYYPRLSVTLAHQLKNEVNFLGLIPIPDVMWAFTDNWHVAVIFWNIIAVIVIVAIVLIFMRRLIIVKTMYKPSNDQIKIIRIK